MGLIFTSSVSYLVAVLWPADVPAKVYRERLGWIQEWICPIEFCQPCGFTQTAVLLESMSLQGLAGAVGFVVLICLRIRQILRQQSNGSSADYFCFLCNYKKKNRSLQNLTFTPATYEFAFRFLQSTFKPDKTGWFPTEQVYVGSQTLTVWESRARHIHLKVYKHAYLSSLNYFFLCFLFHELWQCADFHCCAAFICQCQDPQAHGKPVPSISIPVLLGRAVSRLSLDFTRWQARSY